MRITLTTDTDTLQQLIEAALDKTDLGRGDPVVFDAVTDEVLDAIARQAVAQLGVRTLERDTLAALDRARDGGLVRESIFYRAIGRLPSADTERRTLETVLSHLVGLGYVAHGSGPRHLPGTWYFITEKGRTALRS